MGQFSDRHCPRPTTVDVEIDPPPSWQWPITPDSPPCGRHLQKFGLCSAECRAFAISHLRLFPEDGESGHQRPAIPHRIWPNHRPSLRSAFAHSVRSVE